MQSVAGHPDISARRHHRPAPGRRAWPQYPGSAPQRSQVSTPVPIFYRVDRGYFKSSAAVHPARGHN